MNNSAFKGIILWTAIIIFFILLYNLFYSPEKRKIELTYSEFLEKVSSEEVKSVLIKGSEIEGLMKDGTQFHTYAPNDPQMIDFLRKYHVDIAAKPAPEEPLWKSILIGWAPMILLILVWIFFMRQMQAGSGKAFSFGKSRAKMVNANESKVTFKDVAGIDEAKEELEEIIEFLKNPKKFTKLGGKIPKGVLLIGPPGTGKTLLAKAIAGEAGVPFFSISGSDFVEMFVGVGASRVRDLFDQAKRNAPSIIFIDEIDAVGRQRGTGLGGGHDEREQTLNQLLVEMDGFDANEEVIVIAATNRPDVLDPALLRPGRFDRRIVIPRPDVKGRLEILKVHTRNKPLAEDVNLEILAKSTPGFSGADLANLVNEAALIAARKNKNKIEMEDFEEAKDKVLMGVERKSMVISEEEKKNTAYHESGHALVAKLTPGADPVHKVTIIPRGMALGVTQQLPIDDRYTYTKEYLMANIAVLMGGRAAEEIVLGHITTGAGNDIDRATEIARKMVCEWGMSERLGPLSFGHEDEAVFLGRDLVTRAKYSEETARLIDEEVKRIVVTAYNYAKNLLKANIQILHEMAKVLLEKEIITSEEIDEIISRFNVVKGNIEELVGTI